MKPVIYTSYLICMVYIMYMILQEQKKKILQEQGEASAQWHHPEESRSPPPPVPNAGRGLNALQSASPCEWPYCARPVPSKVEHGSVQ